MQFVAKEMNSKTSEINIGSKAIGFKNAEIFHASEEMKIGRKIMRIAIQEIKLNGIAIRPDNRAMKVGALFSCFLFLCLSHKCDG